MDNAYLGSIDISMKKAKTVTSFNGQFPSSGLLTRSQPGGDLFGIEETNGGLVSWIPSRRRDSGRVFADQRYLLWLCRLFLEAGSRYTIMMGILLVR